MDYLVDKKLTGWSWRKYDAFQKDKQFEVKVIFHCVGDPNYCVNSSSNVKVFPDFLRFPLFMSLTKLYPKWNSYFLVHPQQTIYEN